MASREEAQEFLSRLYSCIPRSFYSRLDAMQKGYTFVLSCLLRADEEVIAGDLAKKLHVSTARIAALLNRMEECGYVIRCASETDGRRTVVKITPAGEEYISDIREQTLGRIEKLLDSVSKEDLETYIAISREIRDVMED